MIGCEEFRGKRVVNAKTSIPFQAPWRKGDVEGRNISISTPRVMSECEIQLQPIAENLVYVAPYITYYDDEETATARNEFTARK